MTIPDFQTIMTDPVTDPFTDPVKRLLHFLDTKKSSSQLRETLNVTHRHYFCLQYIQPALEMGLIEYTIPEKPSSCLQRYRLTRKGRGTEDVKGAS